MALYYLKSVFLAKHCPKNFRQKENRSLRTVVFLSFFLITQYCRIGEHIVFASFIKHIEQLFDC